VTNDPDIGIATASSPMQSMVRNTINPPKMYAIQTDGPTWLIISPVPRKYPEPIIPPSVIN
jgi:hypothetical protein